MTDLAPDSAETRSLLARGRAGDRQAFDRLFARHRARLCEFIEVRLDPRLRARLDPEDVAQETQLEAFRRLPDFLASPPMPFHVWLRKLAYERLLMQRRRHVNAARRSVHRELPLPDRSSLLLAQQLLAPGSTPSEQMARKELARRVRQVLAQLPETDRDILFMRNFEGLSYNEIGCILDIDPAAARKRHGRALLRLHKLLGGAGTPEEEP